MEKPSIENVNSNNKMGEGTESVPENFGEKAINEQALFFEKWKKGSIRTLAVIALFGSLAFGNSAEAKDTDGVTRQSKRMQYYRDQFKEKRLENTKRNQQAAEFAEKMGIDFDKRHFDVKTNGHVITEINGIKVPTNLYTPEQIEKIRLARSLRSYGNDKSETAKAKPGNTRSSTESFDLTSPDDF